MATYTLIGDTTWTEIPGGSESSSDDGSFTVTRLYNGAITGGSGGSGAASWAAFRAAYPPGTKDPTYGTGARSTAYPSITAANKGTYVASITFAGGTYEPGKETTKPKIAKRQVSKVLTIKHVIFETEVELSYNAWQTTISYTISREPAKAGEFQNLADTTVVLRESPPMLQKLPDDLRLMTDAEIATLVADDLWLEGVDMNRRSEEDGSEIWEVSETWVKGLKNA